MANGGFKTVCYRCSYEGQDTTRTRCPECQFPLILESEDTPPAGHRVEEIFARRSLDEGAPPLPGVHREPRKAQILAEARRRRIEDLRAEEQKAAVLRAADIQALYPARRFHRLKVALLCVSAVAAGVVAAVIHAGV